jgi:caffeoyl-CoA O-methyltransferase
MIQHKRLTSSAFAIVILLTCVAQGVADARVAYDIPRVDGLSVDGRQDDWGPRGFRVGFLTTPDGRSLPADDFDVAFRLGWNADGLAVLAVVRDDVPREHQELTRLWQRDCIELFASDSVGSANRYQVVIAPGTDPVQEAPRRKIYDHRGEEYRRGELRAETSCRSVEGGYVAEALLPWSNLGVHPEPGRTLGFQFIANDDDGGEANAHGGSHRATWYPSAATHEDPSMMYTVRLALDPSDPILLRVDREVRATHGTIVLRGAEELVGRPVTVRASGRVVAHGNLGADDGRAGARFHISADADSRMVPRLEVEVAGTLASQFEELPTLDRLLEKYLAAVGGREAILGLRTRWCSGVHAGTSFEACGDVSNKWHVAYGPPYDNHRYGFDGSVYWSRDEDSIEHAGELCRSVLGWWLNPRGPLSLRELFPEMLVVREEENDGRFEYIVPASTPDGSWRQLHFDAETGLLNRIGQWTLADYREVDGVALPFRLSTQRHGRTIDLIFDEVSHNQTIDEGRFAMPDPSTVFADAFDGLQDPTVLPMLKHLPYEHGGDNIPCRDGRLLHDLIIEKGYKRGLEIGTSNGYSTLWLGLAFRKTGGEVITIEIDPLAALEAQKNFRDAGLDGVIDLRINDAFDEIPRIEGDFDFVFIDAWKPDYLKFLELVKDRVTPGGAITAHNVLSYAEDMQDFLEALERAQDLHTTIHATSREGVSISIKEETERFGCWSYEDESRYRWLGISL